MKQVKIQVNKVGDVVSLEVNGVVVVKGELLSNTNERAGDIEVHKFEILTEGWENV